LNKLDFEKRKVKNEISRNGVDCACYRYKQNVYKEPTDEVDLEYAVRGIFRETFSGFVTESIKDGARYAKSFQPMLLVDSDDAALIAVGDVIAVNGARYRVGALKGLGGVAADVSLGVA
jgi:hypothetical protein